jgi:hypothetical protein
MRSRSIPSILASTSSALNLERTESERAVSVAVSCNASASQPATYAIFSTHPLTSATRIGGSSSTMASSGTLELPHVFGETVLGSPRAFTIRSWNHAGYSSERR